MPHERINDAYTAPKPQMYARERVRASLACKTGQAQKLADTLENADLSRGEGSQDRERRLLSRHRQDFRSYLNPP